MTVLQGGARDAIVWESVHRWFHDRLDELNWFGPLGRPNPAGGQPITIPSITWLTERVDDDTTIAPNTLIISHEDTTSVPLETGSNATIDSTVYWVEFFASDAHIGRLVSGDLYALARGQMAQIDVEETVIPVFDWREPNPTEPLFYVSIEDAERIHGGQNPERPEMRNWYGVTFVIVDEQA